MDAFDGEELPLVVQTPVVEELQSVEVGLAGAVSTVFLVPQPKDIIADLLFRKPIKTDNGVLILELDHCR